MTVHFIGAGPGAPDLLTLRAARIIERCPVCLHAGSLVPREVVALAPEGARVLDTSSMTLDEILDEIRQAHGKGLDVARVHSGDPSIYGAIGEQMRRLEAEGIPFEIVPGVPSFAAAAAALKCELTLPGVSQSIVLTAAALKCELTLPGVSQSIVLTRMPGKASSMPPGETLEHFAESGATLVLHLSVRRLRDVRPGQLFGFSSIRCRIPSSSASRPVMKF